MQNNMFKILTMSKAMESSSFESYLIQNKKNWTVYLQSQLQIIILQWIWKQGFFLKISYWWFVGLSKYDHFHELDSVCADTKQKPSRI